jgi:hypothetical protein
VRSPTGSPRTARYATWRPGRRKLARQAGRRKLVRQAERRKLVRQAERRKL